MDSKKLISVMELRNVKVDDMRGYAKFLVTKDDLDFAEIVLQDQTNSNEFFNAACEYLERFNADVIHTDEAKINTFWTE